MEEERDASAAVDCSGTSQQQVGENTRLLPNTHEDASSSNEYYQELFDSLHGLSRAMTWLVLIPVLIGANIFVSRLTGRAWPATIIAFHWFVTSLFLTKSSAKHRSQSVQCERGIGFLYAKDQLHLPVLASLDIILCWKVYLGAVGVFESFFIDIDGSPVPEWTPYLYSLMLMHAGIQTVLWVRILTLCCLFWVVWVTQMRKQDGSYPPLMKSLCTILRQGCVEPLECVLPPFHTDRGVALAQRWSTITIFAASIWLGLCLASCVSHITSWHLWWYNPENDPRACCDPLDTTECALPFPSFHHMVPDESDSKTGWRVALRGNSLPPMRGGTYLEPTFLNELDGFSTMAPILFYLDGLKESHAAEAEADGFKARSLPSLIDSSDRLEDSVTDQSITLLWDVDRQVLMHHTAHFDNLDPNNPMIILLPSKPLHHGSHYAVAVVNATDVDGVLLPRTLGMKSLFGDIEDEEQEEVSSFSTSSCHRDLHRLRRYQRTVLPALQHSAPWLRKTLSTTHPGNTLQLLFDFVTMSEDSLASVRGIRDATLASLSEAASNSSYIQTDRIVEGNCSKSNKTIVARTVHGTISVPWFLSGKRRDSVLMPAPHVYDHPAQGEAKFSAYIPCSLRAATINDTSRTQRPWRATIDYGHGVFYNRAEASEHFMLRTAEDQGYVVIAMDWRGMSSFDMPIVMRTLLSNPALLEASRDNVIQGYANKIAMQTFAKNEMQFQQWMRFSSTENDDSNLKMIPTFGNRQPKSIFYGNSQGGILGAGYLALLGASGLIEAGILGVPGLSFSLIMSHSDRFETYDGLLIKNFYYQRHIRIVMSVMQLAWDPIEGAGLLAPPISEAHHPPILLQAGLGDPTIPLEATEALARAYKACVVPNNPRRNIFGLTQLNSAEDRIEDRCNVMLTELLYKEEYPFPSVGDADPGSQHSNTVHMCLRQDCGLISQMTHFINTGEVIDPCTNDQCIRSNVSCFLSWRRNNTKPSNWTCPV